MFAKVAVAVAVGFLGAYPLASSSGLMSLSWPVQPGEQGSVVAISGIILGLLTLSLIGPTLQLVRQVVATLGRLQERPRPMIAFTMLALGVLCAISSMMVELQSTNRPPAGLSMNLAGMNMGPSVAAQPPSTIVLGLLSVLTFLMGTSLIGLGIWASLKPPGCMASAVVKPAAPELAEMAL